MSESGRSHVGGEKGRKQLLHVQKTNRKQRIRKPEWSKMVIFVRNSFEKGNMAKGFFSVGTVSGFAGQDGPASKEIKQIVQNPRTCLV